MQDKNCCVNEVRDAVQRMVRIFQLFERDQIKIHNFTTSQCYCLLEVLKSDGLTMQELSNKMNLKASTMTRIIDKLERDGYIKRERYEQDRRVVIALLTDKGRSAAKELDNSLNTYYKQIIEHLPTGKVEEVLESTDLLIKAFEKANPNCC